MVPRGLVLQAILDLPKDAVGYVSDGQIAQTTKITAEDVTNWIETLEGEGDEDDSKGQDPNHARRLPRLRTADSAP
jgi:hypothetical protein